jgi:PKHD-type hydroxylase
MPLIHDVRDAFSDEECDALIALAEAAGLAPATTYGGRGETVDARVRAAETGYHPRGQATAWVYERLDRLFAEAGPRLGVRPAPVAEPFQIVRYREGGHFASWHSDAGYDARASRRLSASVELSPPEAHDGGWLEIVPDTVGRGRDLPRGGARVFPSQALHRVTPVTRGLRYALVVWTGGEAA